MHIVSPLKSFTKVCSLLIFAKEAFVFIHFILMLQMLFYYLIKEITLEIIEEKTEMANALGSVNSFFSNNSPFESCWHYFFWTKVAENPTKYFVK